MKNYIITLLTLFVAFSGGAQFGPLRDYEPHNNDIGPREMVPIDFDLDGDLDLVMIADLTGSIFWYETQETGAPEFHHIANIIGHGPDDMDTPVVDYDMDGDYDIMVVNNDLEIILIKNIGDGTFTQETLLDSYETTLFQAVDFDGDDDIDLVGISDESIYWFETDETGAIIEEHELETAVLDETIFTLFDIDNDLDLDIFWGSSADGGAIYFIENLGGGIFDDRVTVSSGLVIPSSIAIVDLDEDTDLDVLLGSWSVDGGKIHWVENTGGAVFGGTTLISNTHEGKTRVISNDIDLDGDNDLLACSSEDDKVVWYENTGSAVFTTASILTNDLNYADDIALVDFDNDGDLDAMSLGFVSLSGLSSEYIYWFENATLNPQHVEGQIYYDENENGIMDEGEIGLPWTTVLSDPDGTTAVTHSDGTYSISFESLPDGDYEISPFLSLWSISSAFDHYDVEVSDDFLFMDTLDFGLFPSTFVDSIGTDITGGSTGRCFDTVGVWLSVANLGTTFPSGIIHLELDDSLYYVDADIAPDSIVGQNIYWSYNDLFFFGIETFQVWVGTPDGMDDLTTSVLTTHVTDDFGDILFTAVDEFVLPIICAYDPNDKTPDPLGEGPEGNIPANTGWIEYTIRFQNTGTDYAENVIIIDQLDEDLIWTSIEPLFSSHDMTFEFDPSGEVSFIFTDIMLPDSNDNELESHGFVKFRIRLKPSLAVGTTIENEASIYFDYNPAIITNTALNTIVEPTNLSVDPHSRNDVSVYPNPAEDFAYVHVNVDEKYSIRLLNLLGQEVYSAEGLSSPETRINTSEFEKGLYILVIEPEHENAQLFSMKLIIQ